MGAAGSSEGAGILDCCTSQADRPRKNDIASGRGEALNLYRATVQGDEKTVVRILNERPSLVNARDYGGRTCLHHAVAAGHVSLTNMLLNRGADASIKNNNGHTPIAIAMQNGRDEIVEMLMKTENLGKNPRWPPASAQGGSTAVSSNTSAAIAAKPPQPSPRAASSEQQGNPAAQSTAQQQAAAPQSSAEQVEALYAAGAEKYFEGDYEATEDLYSKALALDPTHLRSLCNYGALMHNVKNNHVQAAALYDRALAVDQNDVVTLYNYALLMEVAKKDFLAAERLYLRALQVDPMHVDTLVNYGSLLKSVHNETATAEKMYVTALQVEPDHIDALCNYALLLRDGLGNREKAKQLIDRALKVSPTDEWLLKHAAAF